MLTHLGWRSLEQRRNVSRLCLFYKIIHGLVAVHLPPYVEHPTRISPIGLSPDPFKGGLLQVLVLSPRNRAME